MKSVWVLWNKFTFKNLGKEEKIRPQVSRWKKNNKNKRRNQWNRKHTNIKENSQNQSLLYWKD